MIELKVHHTTDTAHRIPGHEDGNGKCARLHGHTYGFTVTLRGEGLDANGFLVDFALVKEVLNRWDHHCVLWEEDEIIDSMEDVPGLVVVPFVPTAENMADFLAHVFIHLPLVKQATVEVRETPKTSATVTVG